MQRKDQSSLKGVATLSDWALGPSIIITIIIIVIANEQILKAAEWESEI
jgi:hypothetical protein